MSPARGSARQRVSAISGVAVTLVVSACAQDQTVSLDQLRDAKLVVTISADGTDVDVALGRTTERFAPPCLVLDDRVAARVDGLPLPSSSRGSSLGGDEPPFCELPSFHVTTPVAGAPASSVISLTDGTTTISTMLRSLRFARGFSVAGVLQAGADARFTWTIGSDVSPIEDGVAPPLGATFTEDDGDIWSLGGLPGSGVALDGTTLVVPIPPQAPIGGARVDFPLMLGPMIEACEGVTECLAEPVMPPSLHVTVAP